jgi:predicted DNA-binding protein (UPF0251 family)/predicted Fe-Mo cluster-binding NifX family protein
MQRLKDVAMPVEAFEAIRLADYKGMPHDAAAAAMEVSRQTFGRILSDAHQCVAKVLVEGAALKIHGGDYTLADDSTGCQANEPAVPKRTMDPPSKKQIKETVIVTKLAISSEGPRLDDQLDPRFGRAAGFILVDPKTLDYEYIDNGSGQAKSQGAGIQAAEIVAGAGAEAVLSGHVGPKAFRALEAAGIKVGQNMENRTVRQAIEAYVSGMVTFDKQSNGKGNPNEGGHRQRQGRNR